MRVTTRPQSFKPGTMRRLDATKRAWDYFLRHHAPSLGVPALWDIIAFMLYRVNAELPGDLWAGKLKLQTFVGTELNLLAFILQERYEESFTLTVKQIRASRDFKATVTELENLLGDRAYYVHARPIWFTDEARLLQATSACDQGRQERALVRVLLCSGARGSDVKMIRHRLDVFEERTSTGQPALTIRVPNTKVREGAFIMTQFIGAAYVDVKAWLDKRRQILPHSPYLFVTKRGGRMKVETITASLGLLSERAGYGDKFFSSHSGRMGFACRLAARTMSEGGTFGDILDVASSSTRWAHRSRSILHYVDANISRFFQGGEELRWDAFKEVSPEVLHRLSHLNPVRRKRCSWFCHSPELLLGAARLFGGIFTPGTPQSQIREFIADKLFQQFPELQLWFYGAFADTELTRTHKYRLVCVMLDLGLLNESFSPRAFISERRQAVLAALDFTDLDEAGIDEDRPCPSQPARLVREIELQDEAHEEFVRRIFPGRPNDRLLTIGSRPDSTVTVIHARDRDEHTFQYAAVREMESNQRDGPHYPPAAASGSTFSRAVTRWINGMLPPRETLLNEDDTWRANQATAQVFEEILEDSSEDELDPAPSHGSSPVRIPVIELSDSSDDETQSIPDTINEFLEISSSSSDNDSGNDFRTPHRTQRPKKTRATPSTTHTDRNYSYSPM